MEGNRKVKCFEALKREEVTQMSHVGNGENDFDGLENLSLEMQERVKQARIEARGVIDRLEPFHIDGWADLLMKIDDCRNMAVRNAKLLDPALRERREQQLREEEAKEQKRKRSERYADFGLALLFLFIALGLFTSLPSKTGVALWIIMTLIGPVIIPLATLIIATYLEVRREYRPLEMELCRLEKERKDAGI